MADKKSKDISKLQNIEQSLKLTVPQHIRNLKEGLLDYDSVARSLSSINKEIESSIRLIQKLNNVSPAKKKEVQRISAHVKRYQNQMGSEETMGLFGSYQDKKNRAALNAMKREKRSVEMMQGMADAKIKASGKLGLAASYEDYRKRLSSFPGILAKHSNYVGNLPADFEKTEGTRASNKQRDILSEYSYLKSGFEAFSSFFNKKDKKEFHESIKDFGEAVEDLSKKVSGYNTAGMSSRLDRRKNKQEELNRKSGFNRTLSYADDLSRYTPTVRAHYGYKGRKAYLGQINDTIQSINGVEPNDDSEALRKNKTLTSLRIQQQHIKNSLGLGGFIGTDASKYTNKIRQAYHYGNMAYNIPNAVSNYYSGMVAKAQEGISYVKGTTMFGRSTGTSGLELRGVLNDKFLNSLPTRLSKQAALTQLRSFGQAAPVSYDKALLAYNQSLIQHPNIISGIPVEARSRYIGHLRRMGVRKDPYAVGGSLRRLSDKMLRFGWTGEQSMSMSRHMFDSMIGPNRGIINSDSTNSYIGQLAGTNPYYSTPQGASYAGSALQQGMHTATNNPAYITMMARMFPGMLAPGKGRARFLNKLLGKATTKEEMGFRKDMINEPNAYMFQQALPSLLNSHPKRYAKAMRDMAKRQGLSPIETAFISARGVSNDPRAEWDIAHGYTLSKDSQKLGKSAVPSDQYISAVLAQTHDDNLRLIGAMKSLDAGIRNTIGLMSTVETGMKTVADILVDVAKSLGHFTGASGNGTNVSSHHGAR